MPRGGKTNTTDRAAPNRNALTRNTRSTRRGTNAEAADTAMVEATHSPPSPSPSDATQSSISQEMEDSGELVNESQDTEAGASDSSSTTSTNQNSESQDRRDELIASLQAQLQAARNAQASAAATDELISRPQGSAGRTFNLRDAMGLTANPALFKLLRQIARELACAAGMNYGTLWRRQPAAAVAKIGALARQRHEHFKRYPQDWPIEEFLKTYFKNQRAYRSKCDRIARGIPPRTRAGGRRNGRAPAFNSMLNTITNTTIRPPASPRQG